MHSISSVQKDIIDKTLISENKCIEKSVKGALRDHIKEGGKWKEIVKKLIERGDVKDRDLQELIESGTGVLIIDNVEVVPLTHKTKEIINEMSIKEDIGYIIQLFEEQISVLKRDKIDEVIKKLHKIINILKPKIKQEIETANFSEDFKEKLLSKIDDIFWLATTNSSIIRYGSYFVINAGVFFITLLKFAEVAKRKNAEVLLTVRFIDEEEEEIFYRLVDYSSIKQAIKNKDFGYFEKKFNEFIEEKRRLYTEMAIKEELSYGKELSIAKALDLTIEEQGYLIEKLLEEEEIAYALIEMHYKWRNLAYNIIGKGAIMRFEPKVLGKIKQDCDRIINEPEVVAQIVDKERGSVVEGKEYKFYLRLVPKIAGRIKSVIDDAIEKNYELVICGTAD